MSGLPVSVVVVSQNRPDLLKRCLTGLSQVQYAPFEIIVVADAAGLAALRDLPFADDIKTVPFDEANISAARNLGITHAAGQIVAFIDDDAVPEPQWLRYLVSGARHPDVVAMGGFVRGRNGISFQWKARGLDTMGMPYPLEVDETRATVLHPPEGHAVKLEGTNMAVRRDTLVEVGGFDTAFHYFLDETDLCMRLGQKRYATAIVPLAEVHHGFAANRTRTLARVPRDLSEIGASWAVFQRKHVEEQDRARQWFDIRAGERQRLLKHMVAGGLLPGDVRRLMRGLDAGYESGLARVLRPAQIARHPATPFKPFPSRLRPSTVIPTRPLRKNRDLKEARKRVAGGEIVTLLSLSRSSLFHHVWFSTDGIWRQTGGIFGKSDRSQSYFRLNSRRKRIEIECRRVGRQRGLPDG